MDPLKVSRPSFGIKAILPSWPTFCPVAPTLPPDAIIICIKSKRGALIYCLHRTNSRRSAATPFPQSLLAIFNSLALLGGKIDLFLSSVRDLKALRVRLWSRVRWAACAWACGRCGDVTSSFSPCPRALLLCCEEEEGERGSAPLRSLVCLISAEGGQQASAGDQCCLS